MLADLRAQANQLLGGGVPAVKSRLASLHGHPVVVNEWASWCFPCRQESGFLRVAAERLRGRVAFLGIDEADSAGHARAFLHGHPVSYPSYQDPDRKIQTALGTTQVTPITLFYNAKGKRVGVKLGAYHSPAELRSDIEHYLGVNP
jgi:thiol-disulfide isomerase/thioredoxin